MKKIISSLLLALATPIVFAYPLTHTVDFTCPDASILSHFGTYIAGFGSENILGQTNPIYFQSQYPSGVPDSLVNYSNSNTLYDMVTKYITCSFASSDSSESPFDVLYYVTNGQGGLVLSQTNSSLSIAFPLGFKK